MSELPEPTESPEQETKFEGENVLVLGDISVDRYRFQPPKDFSTLSEYFSTDKSPESNAKQEGFIWGGACHVRHWVDLSLSSIHGTKTEERTRVFGGDSDEVRSAINELVSKKEIDGYTPPYSSIAWRVREFERIEDVDGVQSNPARAVPEDRVITDNPPLFWPKDCKDDMEFSVVAFDDQGLGFSSLGQNAADSRNVQGRKLLELLKQVQAELQRPAEYCSTKLDAKKERFKLPFIVGMLSTPNLDSLNRKQPRCDDQSPLQGQKITSKFFEEGNISPTAEAADDTTNIWDVISENRFIRDRMIAIVNLKTLRASGINISSSLSWERTSQDIVAAIHTHPSLNKLGKFRHLIIRIGVTGLLHCYGSGKNKAYQLHYIPALHDSSFDDPDLFGMIHGGNTVVAASIIAELTTLGHGNRTDELQCIKRAAHASVQRVYRLFRDGFGPFEKFNLGKLEQKWDPPTLFRPLSISGVLTQAKHHSPVVALANISKSRSSTSSIIDEESEFAMAGLAMKIVREGPDLALNQPFINTSNRFLFSFAQSQHDFQSNVRSPVREVETESWFDKSTYKAIDNILENTLQARRHIHELDDREVYLELKKIHDLAMSVKDAMKKTSSFERAEKAGKVAVELLHDAFSKCWEEDGTVLSDLDSLIHTPVAKIGKMTLVDRQEIENFRNVSKLIREHITAIDTKKVKRPLSVAVFGPPGSGKSFGVKQIVRSIVSRQRKTAEMEYNVSQFVSVEDVGKAMQTIAQVAKKEIPVVFFDEFDSSFGEKELGWLKLFLGPMEEGAWGTAVNPREQLRVEEAIFVFAGGTSSTYLDFCRKDSSTTDAQRALFSEAKGTDFVSRLQGHIDTFGINPVDNSNESYLLRRAIQLRAELEKLDLSDNKGVININEGLLKALILVPQYRHGGRSLRAVVGMSIDPITRGLSKSSLPPIRQLNMHVDGNRFMDIVHQSVE